MKTMKLIAVLLVALLTFQCQSTKPALESKQAIQTDSAGFRIITESEILANLENQNGPIILDVRTPEEFAEGHIPTAINIPHTEIKNRVDEVKKYEDRGVAVICRSGRRAGLALADLKAAGMENLYDVQLHMKNWTLKGLPVVK